MKRGLLSIFITVIFFNAHAQVSTTTMAGDYKIINIGDDTYGDYTHALILLHQMYNGTTPIDHNYAIGTITAMRGTATAYNRINVVNVNTSSAYSGTSGAINSYDDNSSWSLKTCIYNGNLYLAVDIPYADAFHNWGYYFSGWTSSTGENMKCVPYLVNGVPVNTTLISNIQDFSPNMIETHSVAGLNITGNVGIGTTSPPNLLSVGNGTGLVYSSINGGNSGVTTGAALRIQNGGTDIGVIGNDAAVIGGSYNADLSFSVLNNLNIRVGGTATSRMYIQGSTGNVGIGTTNPGYKLDVNGAFHTNGTSELGSGFLHVSTDQFFDTQAGYTFRDGVGINNPNGTSFAAGETVMSVGAMSNGTSIITTGNIAIGTNDSRGYKLAVAGNAIAESMTVKLQANWPDVVFKKDYSLMPLSDVKTYIDKNQHLPEIPAAAEVEKDGVNLGEMNRLLVKKVEELTLYLIEKDKQVSNLTDKLKATDDRLKKLEQQIVLLPKPDK